MDEWTPESNSSGTASARVSGWMEGVVASPVAGFLRELEGQQGQLKTENDELKSVVTALRQSDAWTKLILDSVPHAMLVADERGRIVSANPAAHDVFAYPAGEMPGQRIEDLIPERFRPGHSARRSQFMQQPQSRLMARGMELPARHGDGSEFLAEIGLAGMRLGERTFVVVSVADISERKRAETELQIAATAFESQSGMMVTDPQGVIIRVNRAFTQLTGFSAEEAVGQTPSMLRSGRHPPEFYAQMWATITEKGYWQGQIWNRRKSGRIYAEWLTITAVTAADGRVTHYVSTFSDVTENSDAEARIYRLAYYDSLTGLPNRRLLQDRLGQALASSARNGLYGAVLFLDLDHFKTVNDTLGHDTGDQLLIQMTQRLRLAVREGDTVARLGGDEFVVLLEELGDTPDEAAALATHIAEKLGTAISEPCTVNGDELTCTVSIGIGLFGTNETSEDLLKHADLAMYHAKTGGRNTLRFFDPAMQARLEERSALETELRKALRLRQLELFYQPLVTETGKVIGAETLLRWRHPQRGLIPPMEFIPLAEECGLILPIGQWVLETACTQLADWAADERLGRIVLSVNVSARQFRQGEFVDLVRNALAATGANPARLKIELTESAVLDNVDDAIQKMQLLKALGISFALDDFGTGYSSLAYLTQLPIDQLKIDRSFVHRLPDNLGDAVIARTIITMGRSLALDVIAEGVETQEQRAFLEHHGCHSYQGYLYSKALPLDQFEKFLAGTLTPVD